MANLRQEIWKPIQNYDGIYEVSNLGNIKSLNYRKSGKESILKQGIIRNGYKDVALWNHGIVKYPMVHRIVAIAFIPNPNNLPQVNHKDGNKSNNHVGNLEWCTSSENHRHALKEGLRVPPCLKGEKHGQSKITNKQAIEIFHTKGLQREIAKQFGISRDIVSNIKTGRCWKHLNLK